MTKNSLKPELTGTRSGCEIRFTCPVCNTVNAIINRTPREFYRSSRDATCKQCKKRSTIVTTDKYYASAPAHV